MKKLISIMLLLSVSVCSACSNAHTNSKEERCVPEGADYYTAKDLVLADEYKTKGLRIVTQASACQKT